MTTIELRENLNIKHIKEFFKEIKEALQGDDDEIVLDFAAVTEIDTSVTQVLFAAKKKAKNLNKVIKLKQVDNHIKRALRIAGLIK